MPNYAWYSKKSAAKDGTATWTRPDGSDVEVSFVADGPDELSVDPGIPADDLVFIGEVVKCRKLANGVEDLYPFRPEDFVDPGDFE